MATVGQVAEAPTMAPISHPPIPVPASVPSPDSTALPATVRFTVEQYEQMGQAGILTENDKVELIRGEILKKMNIGSLHMAAVNRLTFVLVSRLGDRGIVSVQNAVRLPDSIPEPDLAVLRPRTDFYAQAVPRSEDVLLVIEVADTSLRFDRETKLPLYAEVGIRECWIVDVRGRSVEVCRGPRPDGAWTERRVLDGDQELSLVEFPDVRLTVREIVGEIVGEAAGQVPGEGVKDQ